MPVIVIGVLVTVFLVSAFLWGIPSGTYYGPPFYGWWYGAPFFGWFFFIPLVFLLFFGLRWFFWRPWGWYGSCSDSAVETLRQRFARGEITKEQFEQMSKDLERS